MPMPLRILLFLLTTVTGLFAAAPEGIPRELARQRASAISDVRYHLRFTLTPHAPSTAGHEEIEFRMMTPAALLLDFRGGTLSSVMVNGKSATAQIENGHIQ